MLRDGLLVSLDLLQGYGRRCKGAVREDWEVLHLRTRHLHVYPLFGADLDLAQERQGVLHKKRLVSQTLLQEAPESGIACEAEIGTVDDRGSRLSEQFLVERFKLDQEGGQALRLGLGQPVREQRAWLVQYGSHTVD